MSMQIDKSTPEKLEKLAADIRKGDIEAISVITVTTDGKAGSLVEGPRDKLAWAVQIAADREGA